MRICKATKAYLTSERKVGVRETQQSMIARGDIFLFCDLDSELVRKQATGSAGPIWRNPLFCGSMADCTQTSTSDFMIAWILCLGLTR